MEAHPARDSRSPDAMTPTEERLLRDWAADPHPYDSTPTVHNYNTHSSSNNTRRNSAATTATYFTLAPSLHRHPRARSGTADPPTAFHAIFGTALFLMGTLISSDPTLALPDEPHTASTYWLAALDVFETGENMPCVVDGRRELPEDWRMAVSWARTLICIADEKLEHTLHPSRNRDRPAVTPTPTIDAANGWCAYAPSAGPFSQSEPRWPKSSPFHIIAATRPPVTRRMSLWAASAHDVLVLAMDQFSRGIFHMPHPHYPHTHNPTGLQLEVEAPFVEGHGQGFERAFQERRYTRTGEGA